MVPSTRKLVRELADQKTEWISTNVRPDIFNLKSTLNSGQAFRWVEITETQEFIGIIGGRVWRLQQLSPDIPVSFHASCATIQELDSFKSNGQLPSPLLSYFRLDSPFDTLFESWVKHDSILHEFFNSDICLQDKNSFNGLRLLNQDPRETIFAFITSANNNVPRISKLLTSLSKQYGEEIWSNETHALFSFPTLEALTPDGMESELREIGFGYRAKFIPEVAKKLIAAGGDEFLAGLRNASYKECKDFLLQLPGIGNKVADCICLSCLDKVEVVPVDIHILRAAALRGIHPPTSSSSLTDIATSLSVSPNSGIPLLAGLKLNRAKQLKAKSFKKTKMVEKKKKKKKKKKKEEEEEEEKADEELASSSSISVTRPKRTRRK